MNGIEKIREKIMQEAAAQAETHREKAEKQAAEIAEAGRQAAEEKKREILDRAEQEARETERRLLAAARLEAKKEKLLTQQKAVEQVFGQVLDKMGSMPGDRYVLLLAGLVMEAAQEEEGEIVLSASDRLRLGEDLMAQLAALTREQGKALRVGLSEDTADIRGGFILRLGDVEINHSFEAWLRTWREELEREAHTRLFGEGR